MPRVIDVVDFLTFPDLIAISQNAIIARATEHALVGADTSTEASIRRAVCQYRTTPAELLWSKPALFDTLSIYTSRIDEDYITKKVEKRLLQEFEVYFSIGKSQSNRYRDPLCFIDDALKVNSACVPGGGKFRTGVMHIPDGQKDCTTRFPYWKRCPALVERIAEYVSAHGKDWPTVSAMVAYGGMVHAHPFSDGNGRTARIMYNLVLRSHGIQHFLPISLVAALTGNNFTLKLRRILLGNDWSGLHGYLLEAVNLSMRWQAEPESL